MLVALLFVYNDIDYLRKLHCPITMCWRNTSELSPFRIFLEVLKTCGRNIQTSHMNLTEHVLAQRKWLIDMKIHLHQARINKSLIINELHRSGHIHFLNDSSIKCMLTNALQSLWKIYLLQSPTSHKGSIWNLRDTIRKNNGCQFFAGTECVWCNRSRLSRNRKFACLSWRTKNQRLPIF